MSTIYVIVENSECNSSYGSHEWHSVKGICATLTDVFNFIINNKIAFASHVDYHCYILQTDKFYKEINCSIPNLSNEKEVDLGFIFVCLLGDKYGLYKDIYKDVELRSSDLWNTALKVIFDSDEDKMLTHFKLT